VIAGLAEGRGTWAIPWPYVHEFLALVTHSRVYRPPTPLARAIDQVNAWLESPSLVTLAENDSYWAVLADCLSTVRAAGARVHDAPIAALCLAHGVRELCRPSVRT
jgi:uncharacterized protein